MDDTVGYRPTIISYEHRIILRVKHPFPANDTDSYSYLHLLSDLTSLPNVKTQPQQTQANNPSSESVEDHYPKTYSNQRN